VYLKLFQGVVVPKLQHLGGQIQTQNSNKKSSKKIRPPGVVPTPGDASLNPISSPQKYMKGIHTETKRYRK
jgi:hypothetical protein